jgi:hypothetical protein
MKLTFRQKLLQKKQDNYQSLRKMEYPSIEDQLDMLFWDMENDGTSWRDVIRQIKVKYPKPGKLTVTNKHIPLPRPSVKRTSKRRKKK